MIVYGVLPLVSYLVGALPIGFLLVRFLRGVDLREVGSGNLGATNATRVLGAKWFPLVFTLDFLKGFGPAFGLGLLATRSFDAHPEIGIVYGSAAIVGHIWPVYLQFRGGKGVATAAGVVTGVAPAPTGVAAVVFLTTFLVWRYVSFASISAAVAMPIAYFVIERGPILRATPIALVLLALLVIIKHRSNLKRLIAGTEPKAIRRKKEGSDA